MRPVRLYKTATPTRHCTGGHFSVRAGQTADTDGYSWMRTDTAGYSGIQRDIGGGSAGKRLDIDWANPILLEFGSIR